VGVKEAKEKAILDRRLKKFEAGLDHIKKGLKKSELIRNLKK